MKKIFIIFFFILSACGYNPIYQSNQKNYIFNEIVMSGEKKLIRQIISALSFKEDKTNEKLSTILLDIKKNKISTSKNTKGQITSYRLTISLNLIIEENSKKIKEKKIVKDLTYNTKENKFDLAEYEKQVEQNLMQQIIEEVNIFLNI